MVNENMKNALFEFDDIAKELEITYCLGQGTCLGFYRDGDFIKGDNDIDIEICVDKVKLKTLFNRLLEMGYEDEDGIAYCNIISDKDYELNQHFKKEFSMLDILFKFDGYRKKFHKKFQTIEFEGRTFNLPSPVEEYLELEFGKDWNKPKDLKSRGMKSLHPYIVGKAIKFPIINYFKYG